MSTDTTTAAAADAHPTVHRQATFDCARLALEWDGQSWVGSLGAGIVALFTAILQDGPVRAEVTTDDRGDGTVTEHVGHLVSATPEQLEFVDGFTIETHRVLRIAL